MIRCWPGTVRGPLQASRAALALFQFGQAEAAKRGLLLVDTKYEMATAPNGSIVLVDEARRCVYPAPFPPSSCTCASVYACNYVLAEARSAARYDFHRFVFVGASNPIGLDWLSVQAGRSCRSVFWLLQIHTPDSSRYLGFRVCWLLQIHTPDSSRYWLAESYEERHAAGQEPMNIDKEFLRLWFREHCDPYADEVPCPVLQSQGCELCSC